MTVKPVNKRILRKKLQTTEVARGNTSSSNFLDFMNPAVAPPVGWAVGGAHARQSNACTAAP